MSGGGGSGGGVPQSGGGMPQRPGMPMSPGKPNGPPPPNTNMPARPDKFVGMPQMPNNNVGVWQPGPAPGVPFTPAVRGGPDPQRPGMPPTPMPQGMPGRPMFSSGNPGGVPINLSLGMNGPTNSMNFPGGRGPSAPMPQSMPFPTYRGGIGMFR